MRISRFLFPEGPLEDVVAEIVVSEEAGFDALWMPQIFGWDTLTVLALAGSRTRRIELGTAVVPTQPTHPLTLAASALTTQAAGAGRLTLGVGVSHKFVVEGVWGYSFERPVEWIRDYLSALLPALRGAQPSVETARLTARALRPLDTPGVSAPQVVMAAMGPRMLEAAGELCDGTVTWMTGRVTAAEHTVPRIRAAAERAGRPRPRVVVGLPVCATSDVTATRAAAQEEFGRYGDVPSYRAMLDHEGASEIADIAIVGDEQAVHAYLDDLRAAGVTEFMGALFGSHEDRERTVRCLRGYAAP